MPAGVEFKEKEKMPISGLESYTQAVPVSYSHFWPQNQKTVSTQILLEEKYPISLQKEIDHGIVL